MPCAEYYDLLNRVRLEGDWEKWLTFFAEGVLETAENSVNTAQRLVRISVEDMAHIQTLGRLAGSCLQVHQALKRRPVSTIARLSQETSLSLPTVTAALGRLQETGLLTELTGRRRNPVFCYSHYLEILAERKERA